MALKCICYLLIYTSMPSVALSEITPYKEGGLACTVPMHLFVKGLLFSYSKIIVGVLSLQALACLSNSCCSTSIAIGIRSVEL